MKRVALVSILTAVLLLCAGPAARALINPNFTPLHLVEQSGQIVELRFEQGLEDETVKGTVRSVLKGKLAEKAIAVGLGETASPAQRAAIKKLIEQAGDQPALLFAGHFGEGGGATPDGEDAAGEKKGLLHLAGQWIVLMGAEDGWQAAHIDDKLQGTWAGGTDMLLRAVHYILTDDDANLRVNSGVSWSPPVKSSLRFSGAVAGMQPVDLGSDPALLFVLSPQGDRLLRWSGEKEDFLDVTAERKLTSKSQQAVWCDLSGNARLDLVSFDGKELSLYAAQADGTYERRGLDAGESCAGCVSLDILNADAQGRAGILVGRAGAPALLKRADDGGFSAVPLSTGLPVEAEKLGPGGRCLVGDFDGDGYLDILQLFASGSLLYRGEGPGVFSAAVLLDVAMGKGRSAACLGDYDADGRLDVFTVSEEGAKLWQNLGPGQFAGRLALAGELAYVSKPGGIACQTADFNNDGTQDLLIVYSHLAPQLFFNRGFRCFGHAHEIDLSQGLLRETEEGVLAACLGDLNADGGLDFALLDKEGALFVIARATNAGEALGVRPVSRGGAVTVTGYVGKRMLGTWHLTPGAASVTIGRPEAGPLRLQWRHPGGKTQEQEVVVEDGTMRWTVPGP